MRVRSNEKFAYREDLYDEAGDALSENTRTGALDASAEFATQMIPALERAVEHPDMTSELAEILSIRVVDVEYRIETDVNVSE